MDLGKAKLRRNGINVLQSALHPEHGLIWTDGKAIFLAPVHLYRDQVQKAQSLRLGEFDNVQSVHWSFRTDGDGCFMAAVHQQNVTVWHVTGKAPQLAFKQVRKINVHPVTQGCLWNPKSDVLCLLSRQQCSFYFRHTQNRGSFAFPSLEKGRISCGCWTGDGSRLVICVGTALLIYTWTDLTNINEFVTAAWRIPGAMGSVSVVTPAPNNCIVCAVDLPLDALCKNNNNDAFIVPDARKSESDPDGIIRVHGSGSVKDGLLNLQANPKAVDEHSAMLNIIQLSPGLQDPSVIASATVPALLSPDILHFQTESQCVVVGSNSQAVLQVFALLDNHLLSAGHISLEKDGRPKGIGGLAASGDQPVYGVLLMVGVPASTDPTLPSSHTLASFSLALRFYPTRPEKSKLANGHATTVKSASSSALMKSESLRESRTKAASESNLHHNRQSSYKGERHDIRFRSPERAQADDAHFKMSLARVKSGDSRPKLVEDLTDSAGVISEEDENGHQELETERVEFSQTASQFQNAKLTQVYEMPQEESAVKRSRTNQTSDSPKGVKGKGALGNGSVQKPPRSSLRSERSSVPKVDIRVEDVDGNTMAPNPPLASGALSLSTSNTARETEQRRDAGSSTTRETEQRREAGSSMSGEGSGKAEDQGSVSSSVHSSDSNYDILEKEIQTQKNHIEALQKRLQDLSVMVEDSACVFPVRYQNMTEPEAVSIQCVVGGAGITRKFLLDNGRLQLDPVKHAFGLLTVELILDGEPVVLGCNIDGYIPMKFISGSILQVTGIPVTYSPHIVSKLRSPKDAVK